MAEGDAGRGTIVPILVYEDIESAHDYLVATFGFSSGGLHRSDDGIVVHGEVRMGEDVVWLHRVTPEADLASPQRSAASHGGLSVIVPDVDDHCARARAAGARIERDPADQEYGLREYSAARDEENHCWWFSSVLT